MTCNGDCKNCIYARAVYKWKCKTPNTTCTMCCSNCQFSEIVKVEYVCFKPPQYRGTTNN